MHPHPKTTVALLPGPLTVIPHYFAGYLGHPICLPVCSLVLWDIMTGCQLPIQMLECDKILSFAIPPCVAFISLIIDQS